MSRELKFRAWNVKEKKMTYNAEHAYDCGAYFHVDICTSCFGELLDDDNYIIEQYTGLKDKNGKEIYEGDIVEFGLSDRAERGYVAYADEYASFEVYSKRDFIFGCLFGHADKVIGNIHENPELIGGEE